MKGVVFTNFIDMVEETFSPEVADQIIQATQLKSGGAYTAVGTYSHMELIKMVECLSEVSGVDTKALVKRFGNHLFGAFLSGYPDFFNTLDNSFDFLKTLENHIHVEVRKLYPDAELPKFEYEDCPDTKKLVMIYTSSRPFAGLAMGLMESCAEYYQENISIDAEDLSEGEQTYVRFLLQKH